MNNYIRDLLSFLDASPTSVQASQQIVKRLEERGFAALDEGKKWKLKPGAKYYLQRETSVVALVTGSQPLAKTGFQLAAAHIDSPGLKLKPSSLKTDGNVARVAVEVYGGPIISSWIDRELGIAGRAAVNYGKEVRVVPVDLQKPMAVIPNAAIHLNREVNNGFIYNKQVHLQAIVDVGRQDGDPLKAAVAKSLKVKPEQIVELELFLYDFAKAALGGLQGNLLFSGRLDNLGMSHAILSAIMASDKPKATCAAVLYDHEEIGSETRQGAGSSMLSVVLDRVGISLGLDAEERHLALSNSFLISADMAHAYHPSYPEKYEQSCSPVMNGGPVIKWQAGHKYATTAASAQRFAALCEAAKVPCQKFMMRSDLLCGSTVGPIVSAQLGIPVVDVGDPLWAMHSTRETAGVEDHLAMIKVLTKFYS
jgi:aspartyl aminopeptidase